jgi:MerR family transcriptional regulator, light-induced transcriptional regulator
MSHSSRVAEWDGFVNCDSRRTAEDNARRTDPPRWQPSDHMVRLTSTIEADIIPRLLLAHDLGAPGRAQNPPPQDSLSPVAVSHFVAALLGPDVDKPQEIIDGYIARGISLKVILLDLMTPAARNLGDMWTADLCNFVDVTLGVSRMQSILRRQSGQVGMGYESVGLGHRALLVPAPGEQHTFGLKIVREFLQRDGWDVNCEFNASVDSVIQAVTDTYFDFVGFSLSGETLLDDLKCTIELTRRASLNTSIRVMVGGVIFAQRPALAKRIGADFFANDAQEAVGAANHWLRLN